MTNINSRNIGLDVLRILLAFGVVGIHILAPATGAVLKEADSFATKLFCNGFLAICYPAVNTYVILSGFFAFDHKKTLYNVVKSLGKLWLCLIFFSVLGLIAGSVYNQQFPTFTTIVARLFPISSGEWWYMTNYFVLMSISPMLNKLIEMYSEKSHLYALGGALVICAVIPFFLRYQDYIGLNIGYGIIWFVVLYYTGAYLYRIKDMIIAKAAASKYFIIWICITILFVVTNNILSKSDITKGFGFSAYNSVFVYVEAVLLFCSFYTMKTTFIRLKPVIFWMSGVSLASYIFHCQADFGPILWQVTEPAQYANSLVLIPIIFAIILGVFMLSAILECTRKLLLKFIPAEKWINRVIDKLYPLDLQ